MNHAGHAKRNRSARPNPRRVKVDEPKEKPERAEPEPE